VFILDHSENSPISSEYFLKEARRLVDESTAHGIVLRLLGALAVRTHSPEFANLHQSLGRLSGQNEFTDIDVMGYGKQSDKLEPFFKTIGFNAEPRIRRTPAIWAYRQMYLEPKGQFHVDVFFDALEMSHTIDFRKRLEVDYPTISLADILLEKMQIHHINEKDIKDSIVLLRAHEIGDHDKETVNENYIAQMLRDDWGFFHTVNLNLEKTKRLLEGYNVPQSDKDDVVKKIDRLTARIEAEPKSSGFKLRARVGEKKKWYNDVDEVIRE
jgi:hypothetical protein